MARRQRAGRDLKIQQGQRRDSFFAKIRRKSGGAPPAVAVVDPAVEPAEEESTGESQPEADAASPES
jgi:hypothetical protein